MKATPSVFLQTGGSNWAGGIGIESPTARPPHPLPFPRASTLAARGAVRCRFAPRAGVDGPRARAFALSPRESVPYFASDGGAPRVVVASCRARCGRRSCHRAALLSRSPRPLALGLARRVVAPALDPPATGRGERRAARQLGMGGGTRDAPDGAGRGAPGPANR
jgi:hypothetical protein